MKKLAIALVVLVIPLLSHVFLGHGAYLGCQMPVSDEAVCVVGGYVYDVDGQPVANANVNLHKTNLDVLGFDWLIGAIVNADSSSFRDTYTDSEGYFEFSFSGAQANSSNQAWAAYFVLWASDPDDPSDRRAFATDSFQFSNQQPEIHYPSLRFWELEEEAIVLDGESVTVSWPDSPLLPEDNRYLLRIEGTEWVAEVDGNSYSIPYTAFEPCSNSLVDADSVCEKLIERKVMLVALAKGIKYRTSWNLFDVDNIDGVGHWYRDPDNNSSGKTCSSKLLYDLNDGKFSGENAAALFYTDEISEEESNCIVIDLQETVSLWELYLHNGLVWFHDESFVEFQYTTAEEPLAADWETLHLEDLSENRFWNTNIHVPCAGEEARYLKILLYGSDSVQPSWFQIGELSVFTL